MENINSNDKRVNISKNPRIHFALHPTYKATFISISILKINMRSEDMASSVLQIIVYILFTISSSFQYKRSKHHLTPPAQHQPAGKACDELVNMVKIIFFSVFSSWLSAKTDRMRSYEHPQE